MGNAQDDTPTEVAVVTEADEAPADQSISEPAGVSETREAAGDGTNSGQAAATEAEEADAEAPADEEAGVADAEEPPTDQTFSARVEDVALAAGLVAYRGADVAAARRQPDVRRVFFDVASVAVVALAALTAFAFANWAAASALTKVVSDWFAAVILALIWISVAILVGAFFFRGEREVRSLRRVLAKDVSDTLPERLEALEEANQTLRDRLDALADAIAAAAQERIAAAILPVAGGMVEVGEDMVDATDDVIEAADEITDAIEENVPGGIVVNRVFDFVLVPGKFGIRVARNVLSLGQPSK
jgi:hypothetical protein